MPQKPFPLAVCFQKRFPEGTTFTPYSALCASFTGSSVSPTPLDPPLSVARLLQIGPKYALDATWDDVSQLCQMTSLPVILKGVLTADDVERAVKAGAKAVIVSNHGGR